MTIDFLPFSELISLKKPINHLEFATEVIRPYFIKSLHYREIYYEKQAEADTIYFMNFETCSLLFYFKQESDRAYYINGFKIGESERQKAWVHMLMLIEQLKKYSFRRKETEQSFGDEFITNVVFFHKASINQLVPFHFIISVLPDQCFPECEEIRLFNQLHLKEVGKEFCFVTENEMEHVKLPREKYDLFSDIALVPPRSRGMQWRLQYNTGIENKGWRKKGTYKIIQKEVDLFEEYDSCGYSQLMQEAKKLLIDG